MSELLTDPQQEPQAEVDTVFLRRFDDSEGLGFHLADLENGSQYVWGDASMVSPMLLEGAAKYSGDKIVVEPNKFWSVIRSASERTFLDMEARGINVVPFISESDDRGITIHAERVLPVEQTEGDFWSTHAVEGVKIAGYLSDVFDQFLGIDSAVENGENTSELQPPIFHTDAGKLKQSVWGVLASNPAAMPQAYYVDVEPEIDSIADFGRDNNGSLVNLQLQDSWIRSVGFLAATARRIDTISMSDDSQRLIDEIDALCESIEGYAVVSERLSFQLLMIREALQSGVYEGNYNDSDYLQIQTSTD